MSKELLVTQAGILGMINAYNQLALVIIPIPGFSGTQVRAELHIVLRDKTFPRFSFSRIIYSNFALMPMCGIIQGRDWQIITVALEPKVCGDYYENWQLNLNRNHKVSIQMIIFLKVRQEFIILIKIIAAHIALQSQNLMLSASQSRNRSDH